MDGFGRWGAWRINNRSSWSQIHLPQPEKAEIKWSPRGPVLLCCNIIACHYHFNLLYYPPIFSYSLIFYLFLFLFCVCLSPEIQHMPPLEFIIAHTQTTYICLWPFTHLFVKKVLPIGIGFIRLYPCISWAYIYN